MHGTTPERRRQALGLLLLVAVAGLSAFLYSPLHTHSRLRSQPCEFNTFEHSAVTGDDAAPALLEPPAVTAELAPAVHPEWREETLTRRATGRAPPA